jgi:hypothetical protein
MPSARPANKPSDTRAVKDMAGNIPRLAGECQPVAAFVESPSRRTRSAFW